MPSAWFFFGRKEKKEGKTEDYVAKTQKVTKVVPKLHFKTATNQMSMDKCSFQHFENSHIFQLNNRECISLW